MSRLCNARLFRSSPNTLAKQTALTRHVAPFHFIPFLFPFSFSRSLSERVSKQTNKQKRTKTKPREGSRERFLSHSAMLQSRRNVRDLMYLGFIIVP